MKRQMQEKKYERIDIQEAQNTQNDEANTLISLQLATRSFRRRLTFLAFSTLFISALTTSLLLKHKIQFIQALGINSAIFVIILAFAWVSYPYARQAALIEIEDFNFKGVVKVVLTELVFGKFLALFLLLDRSAVFPTNPGYQSCLNQLLVYLAIFAVYHNGEFFFVLYCHTKELGWKSKQKKSKIF